MTKLASNGRSVRLLIPCLLAAHLALGAQLTLPSKSFERTGAVIATYKTNTLATGSGDLTLRWTDALGRLVEERKLHVTLNDEDEISIPLDLSRAVAMQNSLRAHLTFDGKNRRGAPDHRDESAAADFIARPPDPDWRDYHILMWQHRTPAQIAALQSIGIDGGESIGRGTALPDFLLKNDLRWYAENIATDFYSEYHRYFPDRPNNWKFHEARDAFKKNRTSKEPLKRYPSLSDPAWLHKIHDRLVDAATFYSPYRPFFYSRADESGIADLAAYYDFDYSDHSLAAFRKWLRERYPTLHHLNARWAAGFTTWDSVLPDTTDEAMRRTDANYTSWSDFKEFMDVAFAAALKMGNDAIRSVDSHAYVGIGGAQMPGWGGYDYSRIIKSLTAIEPYDIGNNIEIIRSLNPDMAVLTTAFQTGPWERHRVWYEFLHGNRGLVLWDDKSAFVNSDATLGPRALEVAGYYKELRGGLGAQIVNSRRVADPIAIHYSQPSMRVEWMLAQRPHGARWTNRNSSAEYTDSEFLRVRQAWCKLIEDQGLQYNFVAYDDVERGALLTGDYKVLILPRSTALSEAEARQIREFVARGGLLIADGIPGQFDERARKLDKPVLADLFDGGARAILAPAAIRNYHEQRLSGKESESKQLMSKWMASAGVKPEYVVTGPDGKPVTGVETHVFRNGGVTFIALLTNPQLRVDELGPPDFRSNDRFAKPAPVTLTLPGQRTVYDIRAGKSLGTVAKLDLTVPPYDPIILAVAPLPIPDLLLSAPDRVSRGNSAQLWVRFEKPAPPGTHVIRVDVLNPEGKRVDAYSGNWIAPQGEASRIIPLALNDPPGTWEIRVRDIISGQTRTRKLAVE
jgi:hypothetical protein